MTPASHIEEALRIWAERERYYGSAYLKAGKIMSAYFPDGLTLKTEEDFGRFVHFLLCSVKLNRYSQNFEEGGHLDSAEDLINYAAILASLTK
jgi:hypothetical protein